MDEIRFVDTTLRDGHQSLWAEGMLTGMILPIAERMDQAGFEAIELVAPSFFKKACREFKEDIWERIRLVRQRVTKTPLRGIRNRYMAGFQVTPACASQLWLERLAANGIRELRSSDPSNTAANWAEMVRSANEVGVGDDHQPHFFRVAQAYRCLLRRARAAGRGAATGAYLHQRPRRAVDA